MKSTIKVSISGIAFNIEDDAYNILKNYLDKLTTHFTKIENGNEIIDDIEARLAELLLSKISKPEQAITVKEVNEAIEVLGKPEDLNDSNDSDTRDNTTTQTSFISTKKRLYRNAENQVIAGVCSGLGVYFNINPIIFRILFVVLTISAPFLWFINLSAISVITYAVLWISLPIAQTIAQKLEMQGESPSVANMERKKRKEAMNSSEYTKPQHNAFAKLIRIGFYTIASIAAIPAIAVGFALTVAFIAVTFAGGWVLHDTIFPIMNFVSISGSGLLTIKVFALITIVAPFLLLIYIGIRLLFRFKTKGKSIIALLGITWIISVVLLTAVSAFTLKDYRNGAQATTKEVLTTPSDTLYIRIPQNFERNNTRFYIGWSSNNHHPYIPYLWASEQEDTMYIYPKLDIRHVNDSTFYISYTRYARAKSKGLAEKKIETLPLQYSITDSLVTVMPQQFTKDKKWSGEFGKLTIYVPRNKKIILDENVDHNNKHYDYWDDDFN